MLLEKKKRNFVPEKFDVQNKEELTLLIDRLKDLPTESKADILTLMKNMSETESVISEQGAWIQVHLTTDTANKAYEESYNYFVTEVSPILKQAFFDINSKIVGHPYFSELKQGALFPALRALESEIEIFTPENIPLESEESLLGQKFSSITGRMSIEYKYQTYTLQQAGKFLESEDRSVREDVYQKIQSRRGEDQEELMDLYIELRDLRHQIAAQAGFENYRDYKFKSMGRFDYTPEDCYAFHDNVKKYFVPLWENLIASKKEKLRYEEMRPWDMEAPLPRQHELSPFEDGRDLTFKSITLFGKMDSYFADCLKNMDSLNRLDLDSRMNKAPGGYNCPMSETGVPFIFMNSAGTVDDLITMMHEAGHAFHAFLSFDLEYQSQKEVPIEVAELASMSMELMTLDYWDTFLAKNKELKQAQSKELERVISVLPWVATIDKFQHWVYTHHGATGAEITTAWNEIFDEFAPQNVSWQGLEDIKSRLWQKQLHLFEVPFYYIEYGIAQIGAIELWMNYRKHPKKTLNQYKSTLALGYTKTIPELYAEAGISWGFGEDKMKRLAQFLQTRLN